MSHVELSPSSASRWLKCPGSVALSRGIPDRTSAAAEEGTKAHALAEHLLNHGVPPEQYDREMYEYVATFADFCSGLVTPNVERTHATEQWLSLAALGRPDMGGTADFICWSPERLDIVDLKYGKGVFVDATDNPQLLYYGLMGLLWCEERGYTLPPTVRITIVQPRIEYAGDTIRSTEYSLDDMMGFADTLLKGAIRVSNATMLYNDGDDPDSFMRGSLQVGDHCRWCKAITICPAQRQLAVEVAQQDFDVVTPQSLPAATLLTNDELGGILARATWLGQWVKALQSEAEERLGRNEKIPGWKLVPKRGNRKWIKDEDAIFNTLSKLGVVATDEMLRTITDVEKELKKKKLALPESLYTKESSGLNLAPESDARPDRAEIASSEFTVVSPLAKEA